MAEVMLCCTTTISAHGGLFIIILMENITAMRHAESCRRPQYFRTIGGDPQEEKNVDRLIACVNKRQPGAGGE